MYQSVQDKSFDHISAIYHLLVDKLEHRSQGGTSRPIGLMQRKASITTGTLKADVFSAYVFV